MNYQDFSIKKIKEDGGRMTKTKSALIDVLDGLQKPLNAYELAERVELSGTKIDVVTVYRILDVFEKLELVHKSGKGFLPCQNYSCENTRHCHDQFLCKKCEKSFEIHMDDNDFLEVVKKKFKDFAIESHIFNFFGVCNECRSN